MLNMLLSGASANTGNSWWIYVVLIVLVVIMLVVPSITNRKRMKEYNTMLDQLRVGDEVRTIGGIMGRVVKINTKGEIKTFTLETGAKGSKTTMEFDMAAIGTVLKSNYVAPVEEKAEKKAEEVNEEPAKEEAKAEEVKAVEKETKVEENTTVSENAVTEAAKPKKKTASKKTTKK